ncbi:MAG TPA: DUF2794 domain-containing protein [Alphaproteobacteria bacterium]|jgi:hypothetical protein
MAQLVRISDFQARKAAQEQLDRTPSKGGRKALVVFSRVELKQLLAVYSRHVIAGDWKAYAIDHGEGAALFSVFQHALAKPLYSIVKLAGQRRNGQWLIVSNGQRLRRSANLDDALELFDRKLRLV